MTIQNVRNPKKHMELLPLLGFVVTIGTFMFIYKLGFVSNWQIDKQKR